MPNGPSRPIPWQELDKKSPAKQKEFLAEYEYVKISVSSDQRNVKKGDVLVRKGPRNKYNHYLLCIDVKYTDDEQPYAIEAVEYAVDGKPWANPLGYLRLGSMDLTGLGKIMVNTYTYEELKKSGVEIEIWPEELERFDVEEVIRRAKRRVGESWYDALKNNCEHFVTSCKCGLKVSHQVYSEYILLRELLYSLVAGGKESIVQLAAKKLKPFLIDRVLPNLSARLWELADYIELIAQSAKKLSEHLKVSPSLLESITRAQNTADRLVSFLRGFANISDELARVLSKKYAAAFIGFAIGIVIEGGVGFYEINKALEQSKAGLIENDDLFWAKIVEIVAKGVCRSCLGLVGSVVGTMFGPGWGSLIGGAIGGAAGHVLGYCIGWWYENRQYLDG